MNLGCVFLIVSYSLIFNVFFVLFFLCCCQYLSILLNLSLNRSTFVSDIIFLKFILFIYFWLCWVFVAVRGLSLVAASGASHCGGFSCCQSWALGAQASVAVACGLSSCGSRALERRLSSCGAWA